MKAHPDDSIPAVLRRRYKALREEGYNDDFLRVLNRAADRIDELENAVHSFTDREQIERMLPP